MLNLRRSLVASLLIGALVAASCARSHQRVDPDEYDGVGGGGTESGDVRTMADRMSRDLLGNERIFAGEGKPTLHILGLQNHGSHPIDREMVLDLIQTTLVTHAEGRLRVLDRSAQTMEEIRAERSAKRAGAVTGSAKKDLLGSDFVLTGTVRTISKKGAKGRSSDYWLYNFRLVDLESSELVWAKPYDFKWAGNKPAVYR